MFWPKTETFIIMPRKNCGPPEGGSMTLTRPQSLEKKPSPPIGNEKTPCTYTGIRGFLTESLRPPKIAPYRPPKIAPIALYRSSFAILCNKNYIYFSAKQLLWMGLHTPPMAAPRTLLSTRRHVVFAKVWHEGRNKSKKETNKPTFKYLIFIFFLEILNPKMRIPFIDITPQRCCGRNPSIRASVSPGPRGSKYLQNGV